MEHSLAFYITLLHKDFSSYVAKELKQIGVSFGQLPFLIYVGKHPGCTPSEVTKALLTDWGHSQRTITKLTEDGFLRKERSRPTSRVCHLFLTESGENAFRLGHEVFYAWDRAYLDGISEDELDRVKELLARIAARGRSPMEGELL